MDSLTCIVSTNSLRHRLNHIGLIELACSHGLKIYIFPADRSRLPSDVNLKLVLEEIFSLQDEGVNIPSQGLFLYTAGMR